MRKESTFMIIIRGNLKTGEWAEVSRSADPRDITIDQAAGALARLVMKGEEQPKTDKNTALEDRPGGA